MRHPHRFTPFLLLALWVNACLGWSAHEAAHLWQSLKPAAHAAAVSAAADVPLRDDSTSDEAPAEGTERAHGVCAACLAFAHLQAALPPPVPGVGVADTGVSPGAEDRAQAVSRRRAEQGFLARAPPAGPAIAPAAAA